MADGPAKQLRWKGHFNREFERAFRQQPRADRRCAHVQQGATRQDLERLWNSKIFLELWVKVRSGWADSEEHLRSYGYE